MGAVSDEIKEQFWAGGVDGEVRACSSSQDTTPKPANWRITIPKKKGGVGSVSRYRGAHKKLYNR